MAVLVSQRSSLSIPLNLGPRPAWPFFLFARPILSSGEMRQPLMPDSLNRAAGPQALAMA
jgi:hypothetical protein